MFERNLIIFWAVVALLLWLLGRYPRHILAMVALAWVGPSPREGETLARFQLRWAAYSLGWFCQIAVLLSVLFAIASYDKTAMEKTWVQVFLFSLPLGAGMALLATLGFLVKFAKAQWLGPNPSWSAAVEVPEQAEASEDEEEEVGFE